MRRWRCLSGEHEPAHRPECATATGSRIRHPQIASHITNTSSPIEAAKTSPMSACGYRYGRRLYMT